MAGHDLVYHLLLHKTPRPITCRALVIGEKLFDGVVIQRRHAGAGIHVSCHIYNLRPLASTNDPAVAGLVRIMEIAPSNGATSRIPRQGRSEEHTSELQSR